MIYNWNKLAKLSAIGTVCSLAAWLGTSNAKEETSVLVNKTAAPTEAPPTGPALPPPSESPQELPAPAVQPRDIVPPQDSASQPKRPFLHPAEPRAPGKGSLVGVETMPSPPGAVAENLPGVTITQPGAEGLEVRPRPSIKYDTDHDARKMYRSGVINFVMLTKDPTGSCAYEIPMSIPACCVGDPLISAREGIFGRGVVEYRWACGFRAIVKFRHVLGDIRVDYEGD